MSNYNFCYFLYFCGTIKLLSAWDNNRPAERAERAERLRRVGWRFPSFPLFLWDNKTNPTSRHVLSPAEIAEIAERPRASEQRFPLFLLFLRRAKRQNRWLRDNKTNPTSRHVLSPTEIAEKAERASHRAGRVREFPLFHFQKFLTLKLSYFK